MAARVTVPEVKVILDDTELSNSVIQSYIVSASTLVDEVLGSTSTTDLSKEVERWLAAHMIASTRERMASKEEAEGAKVEYVGKTYAGLYSTPYGQMVLLLDKSGKFAALDKKQVVVYAVKSRE